MSSGKRRNRWLLSGVMLVCLPAFGQTADVSVDAYFHCARALERAAEVVDQPRRSVYLKRAADYAEAALEVDPVRWNELVAETGTPFAEITRAELVQSADFCLAHLEPDG